MKVVPVYLIESCPKSPQIVSESLKESLRESQRCTRYLRKPQGIFARTPLLNPLV